MDDIEQGARLAKLTAEMAWLRRLARALLRTDEAADLAQDTWLVAKDRVPTDGRPLRPWLSRVARNLAITRARSRQRREARERESKSVVEAPSRPDEIVERVELQKLVATEVLALADPYRSTILLHFFDELTCAEIARRLQLPEGTVRRRLKVGLDELRARLDKKTHKSGAGLAALAPLATAAAPNSTGATAIGIVAMKKLVTAVLVLLVLIVSAVLWHDRRQEHETAAPAAPKSSGWNSPAARARSSAPGWFTTPGVAAKRIAGHVSHRGSPIADATVELASQLTRAGFASQLVARTDKDGAFDLGEQPAAEYDVTATSPGLTPAILHIDLSDPRLHADDLQLRLQDCSASVAGSVLDADGTPIPRAHVRRNGISGVVADDRGRYQICVPFSPGVEVHVFGWAEGLESPGAREALVQVGVPTELTLRLETMARIEGKVVRGEAPVAGARVQAVRPSPVQRSAASISQPDGMFVLDRVPVGALRFLAPPYDVDAPTAFTVEPGKIYRNVVLHLHALGAIRGRVTRLGQPVVGTEVCCAATNAGGPPSAITDANGQYEFVGVAKGTYEIGGGGEAAGAFSLPRKVDLSDGEERTVDIELDQAATIAGTVVDREQKPVQGVFVRWLNEKKGDVGRAITDDLGRYRCTAMTGGGRYRAAVFPSGAAFFASSAGTLDAYPTANGSDYPEVDLANGSSVVENMTIEIDHEQKTISGHVTDDVGAPVVDAIVKAMVMPEGQEPRFHVWLRLPVTSTDANGAFKISGLAPGKYAVQAHAIDGSEGITPNVSAGADDATVRVERAGAISGTLVSFAHTPAVYARTFGTYKYIPGTTDGSTFTIAGVRPGRYFVSAQDADEGDAQIVDVKAGQTANVTLTSHGQGAVDATVVDFRTHQPVPGIGCHAIMSIGGEQGVTNWDPITSARSDDAGRLTIDPAPAGSISLDCPSGDAPNRPVVDT